MSTEAGDVGEVELADAEVTLAGDVGEQVAGEATQPWDGGGDADPRSVVVRVLRLRHVRPVGWQRVALAEGSVFAGAMIAMADLASAWIVLAMPLLVAALVVYHDHLVGILHPYSDDLDLTVTTVNRS